MTLDEWRAYRHTITRRISISPLGRLCILTEQEAWERDQEAHGKAVALRLWLEALEPGDLAAVERGTG